MKSEVINYEKHMAYRQKYEVMLSELSEKELSRLFIMDEHEMETHRFQVLGYDIEVKDALIAEALQTLTEKKRNVVLLSYFMDMSDADIAREMNLVYECFEQIVKNRKKVRVEPIIDGYSRFLFLDKKDMPEVALHWEKHFQWALGKYNRTHEEQMPKITPHMLRHTFCTRCAEAGLDIKVLQMIMGHSDISITMNIYNHVDAARVQNEMKKLENVM
ncbi:tyrosine-type recombinase/integrase [Blautia schinkii]